MIGTPKTDLDSPEAYDAAMSTRRDDTGEWGPVLQQALYRAGLDASMTMDPGEAGALRPSVHVDLEDGTSLMLAAYFGGAGLCLVLDRMDPRGRWDGVTELGTYVTLAAAYEAALGASGKVG